MASGRSLLRPFARPVTGRPERGASRPLAVAVFGSAAVVAVAEGVALAVGCPPVAVLGAGVGLSVPLAFALGGRRLVRRYGEALHDLRTDDVTGARSRRAFSAELPAAVSAVSTVLGHERPLTLALVELTGVDAAVDLFGRRRVEVLIRQAADALDAAPAEAVTYRLAGEVFAVVLAGVGPEAAFDVVDTVLGRLARAAAPLSAIGGLATLDARCPDAELLLVGASAALDEARALGPGRAVASAGDGVGLRWVATPGTR